MAADRLRAIICLTRDGNEGRTLREGSEFITCDQCDNEIVIAPECVAMKKQDPLLLVICMECYVRQATPDDRIFTTPESLPTAQEIVARRKQKRGF